MILRQAVKSLLGSKELENEGREFLRQIDYSKEKQRKRKAVLSLNNPIVRSHLRSRSLFLRKDEISLEMEQCKVNTMIHVLKILIRNKVCTYYEKQKLGSIILCNYSYDYKTNKKFKPDEELSVWFSFSFSPHVNQWVL